MNQLSADVEPHADLCIRATWVRPFCCCMQIDMLYILWQWGFCDSEPWRNSSPPVWKKGARLLNSCMHWKCCKWLWLLLSVTNQINSTCARLLNFCASEVWIEQNPFYKMQRANHCTLCVHKWNQSKEAKWWEQKKTQRRPWEKFSQRTF